MSNTSERGRILLIDDDRIIGSVYSRKLADAGYDVRVARDGSEAQEAFEEFFAHLFIIDIGLPDVNGLEILRAIKAVPEYVGAPVIVFSNSLMFEDIEKAMELGASEIVDKSTCPPAMMIEKINRLFNRIRERSSQADSAVTPLVPASVDHDIQKAFLESIPPIITRLSKCVRELSRSSGNKEHLLPIYNSIHPVACNAGSAGFVRVGRLSEAIESLVKSLYEKPVPVGASAVRTLAQAIDVLAMIFSDEKIELHQEIFSPKVLIVEDDRIAAKLACKFLEKIQVGNLAADNAETALDILDTNHFDLILLDAELPGMSGDDMCRQLRKKPAYAETPVIFVTSLSDFDFRAKSVLSGGNDLLGKPYIPMELAVKVLTYILKSEFLTPKS